MVSLKYNLNLQSDGGAAAATSAGKAAPTASSLASKFAAVSRYIGGLSGLNISKRHRCDAIVAADPIGEADPHDDSGRVLTTLLFTDIVNATATASALGDRRWCELLRTHHALVRDELGRYCGSEIDVAGDGFFAAFTRPVSAIRCASRIAHSLRSVDLWIRAGIHIGECEVIGSKPGGIAVHIAARIASEACAGEVLVSSTVKDVMTGSAMQFEDRGSRALKGIPTQWRLFAVRPEGDEDEAIKA